MKSISKSRKLLRLFAIGYMGGSMYLLKFIRYVFFEQMMTTLDISYTQMGYIATTAAVTGIIITLPGAYLSDVFEAKKNMLVSITLTTALNFIFAAFVDSYIAALIIWALLPIVSMAYWGCLMKYLTCMDGEEAAGGSLGKYYLINGLVGALGNALPLWACDSFGGFRAAVIAMGIYTALAIPLIIFFVDDEKTLAEQGIYLKGDEPIRIKHIPIILKWPGTYMLMIGMMVAYALYSNVSYLNPYLIDVIGVDPSTSSGFSVIRSYGAMLVAPLGGFMADKVFKSTAKWFIAVLTTAIFVFAAVFLFGPESNKLLVSVYSLIPSLVIYGMYSIVYSVVRELHVSPTVVGTVIGLSGYGGNLMEATIPTLFGAYIDKFGNQGYTYVFLTLIALCVIGILNALWILSHDKKCKEGKRVMNLGELETGTAK